MNCYVLINKLSANRRWADTVGELKQNKKSMVACVCAILIELNIYIYVCVVTESKSFQMFHDN